MEKRLAVFPQQPYAMGYQTIWWAAVETTAPKKSVVIEKNVLSNPAWIDADCLMIRTTVDIYIQNKNER